MLRPYDAACAGGVMRLAPEGWHFILPGWALVGLGDWMGRGLVRVREIAGIVVGSIVTDGTPGGQARQGERFGMIRFGSRVDVFLPSAARAAVRVAVGERVRAGATLLAEYAP